jgi:hypothetical protein
MSAYSSACGTRSRDQKSSCATEAGIADFFRLQPESRHDDLAVDDEDLVELVVDVP